LAVHPSILLEEADYFVHMAIAYRQRTRRSPVFTPLICLCAAVFFGAIAGAAENSRIGKLPDLEGALHGFPGVFDLDGKKLADGEFVQWLEGGQLHVKIDYDFGAGHTIEEQAVFRQEPELVQEAWSWRESRNGQLYRHFSVDFVAKKAAAEKFEGKDLKKWSEDVEVQPGQTFAGFGFSMALKSLRENLVRGQKHELHAIAFTPKPRVVNVELSYGGREQMFTGGRTVTGDLFIIHPKVPLVAKAFIEVHDTKIWLTLPRPTGFLRWEGATAEPSDPLIRVDLLPAEHSGAAQPK
jgi:hypothetical protein